MIWSDRDIKKALADGRLAIQPFDPRNLTPNGYDLTVGDIYIGGETRDEAVIPPMTWFALSTAEYIRLKNVTAQLWIRSTYARKGVFSSFGKVDAGFEGCLTLSCFNTHQDLSLKKGERFCQIVFEDLLSEPSHYYRGKYSGQNNIKLW
ncbi:MAG TPA: dCTP deaminase [Thermoplasmatales archaeon]|nr:MAG: dCTP deaminase [Thermoplasmata archaeon]RLF33549.1 MAG: dCTP deaminase [Thermoplasmata archaeon]RLF54625.1 MAG: dCTP deaminase [Thermoplasmata archaeon]HDN50319.1 dCTP deaminase [Thermoplasmatales archaeon]